MVRITTKEQEDCIVWRVEGSMRGPWVAELEKLWQSARDSGKRLSLRLEDVPYIDDAARELMARMYQDRVAISASGLYVTAIVQEIQSGCLSVRSVPESAE